MDNKNSLSKLRMAVASSFLAVFGFPSSNDIEDVPQPSTPPRIFMTPETFKIYGHLMGGVAHHAKGVTALIITENDLKFKGSEKIRSRIINPFGCISEEEQKQIDDALKNSHQELRKLIDIFTQGSEQDIIPRKTLQMALKNHETMLNSYLNNATKYAISGMATASYLTDSFPSINNKLAIITMPAKPQSAKKYAAIFSGIPEAYIDEPKITSEDWVVFILGHEIAGHALHGHTASPPPDFTSKIDFKWANQRAKDETISDIAGARSVATSRDMGIIDGTDTERHIEAMRALATLYKSSNLTLANATNHLAVHITNWGFDASSPSYASEHHGEEYPNISKAALLINTAADVISGFSHSRLVKDEMSRRPEAFSEKKHKEYQNVPVKPEYIEANLKAFASLGYRARTQNPQWHNESLFFLWDNGLIADLTSDLPTLEIAAINDIITDALNAAKTDASKLYNPAIAASIKSALETKKASDIIHFIKAQDADNALAPKPVPSKSKAEISPSC